MLQYRRSMYDDVCDVSGVGCCVWLVVHMLLLWLVLCVGEAVLKSREAAATIALREPERRRRGAT